MLFELFSLYIKQLDDLDLLVLGRDKPHTPLRDRVKAMFIPMSPDYFSPSELEEIFQFLDQRTQFIDIDLQQEKLHLNTSDYQKLAVAPIDFFFHIAALTDFRDLPIVSETLKRTNVEGTRRILELVAQLQVGELDYVSSAYTCGTTTGDIQPDFVNIHQLFHNPYEHSKLQAEIRVRLFAKRTGVRCRYFRPSTICGRLMSAPMGYTNKFDVFYSFAAFFLALKVQICNWNDRYHQSVHIDLQMLYRQNSGLNIVPVDFAAKAMLQVCLRSEVGDSFHLVNDEETPHNLYVSLMFDTLGIEGIQQVDTLTYPLNEKLYYAKIGKLYTPYITSAPILFNTDSVRRVLNAAGLKCPTIGRQNFAILMDYAQQHDFGAAKYLDPQLT